MAASTWSRDTASRVSAAQIKKFLSRVSRKWRLPGPTFYNHAQRPGTGAPRTRVPHTRAAQMSSATNELSLATFQFSLLKSSVDPFDRNGWVTTERAVREVHSVNYFTTVPYRKQNNFPTSVNGINYTCSISVLFVFRLSSYSTVLVEETEIAIILK